MSQGCEGVSDSNYWLAKPSSSVIDFHFILQEKFSFDRKRKPTYFDENQL